MKAWGWVLVVVTVVGVSACGKPGNPSMYVHEFPALSIGPYEEIDRICQSWSLNNDEPVPVNEVIMDAGPAWHHSNWFYVPDTTYPGGDGTWDCDDRGFDEYTAALAGGVFYAMSTQATHEVQKFTDGAVLELPPHTMIVGDVHLLNTGGEDIKETTIRFELHTLDQFDVRLKPMSMVYRPLDIPPQSQARFTATCDMSNQVGGGAVDFNVYYVLPHYHYLGTGMQIRASGPDTDIEVFENLSKVGDPLGETYDPPLNVTGSTTWEFSCLYNNPTNNNVGWGIGDQEMCVFLAFTDDEKTWAGGVFDDNQMTGVDQDGVVQNTGPCSVFRL